MAAELRNGAIAFFLTIVVEMAVALLLGYRRRVEIACVFWVNVFSWPLLNYLLWTLASLRSAPFSTPIILLFETGVVLVEWQLLCFALPRHSRFQLFVLSLTMNSASYLAGCCRPTWMT
jgi:hypothetical protein